MGSVRSHGGPSGGSGDNDPDLRASGAGLDIDDLQAEIEGRDGESGPALPRVPATPGIAQGGKSRQRGRGLSQITADRPIFTLSVAADLLGLHPRTLRIYEEKGLVVPARTEGNRRRYSQNDIQRFQFVRQLTIRGVNLEGVRIILDMADELTKLGGDPEGIIERYTQSDASIDEP